MQYPCLLCKPKALKFGAFYLAHPCLHDFALIYRCVLMSDGVQQLAVAANPLDNMSVPPRARE
jgi:hypothetical protein